MRWLNGRSRRSLQFRRPRLSRHHDPGDELAPQEAVMWPPEEGRPLQVQWSIPNVFSDGPHSLELGIVDRQGLTVYDSWQEAASFTVVKEEKTPYVVTPDTSLVLERMADEMTRFIGVSLVAFIVLCVGPALAHAQSRALIMGDSLTSGCYASRGRKDICGAGVRVAGAARIPDCHSGRDREQGGGCPGLLADHTSGCSGSGDRGTGHQRLLGVAGDDPDTRARVRARLSSTPPRIARHAARMHADRTGSVETVRCQGDLRRDPGAVGGSYSATYVSLEQLSDDATMSGPAGSPAFLGAADAFHPNDAGHAAIASVVENAVRWQCKITLSGDSGFTQSRKMRVSVSARDRFGTIVGMRRRIEGGDWSAWRPLAASWLWTPVCRGRSQTPRHAVQRRGGGRVTASGRRRDAGYTRAGDSVRSRRLPAPTAGPCHSATASTTP